MLLKHGSGNEGRLLSLGLPLHLAHSFMAEVVKWESHSGPAWTCNRLKSIKVDLIRDRAGLPPLTWIRRNRRGDWYGVWGALRRYALKSDRCFGVVINTLMYYSVFQPANPTAEHIRKFRESVNALDVFIPSDVHTDLSRHTQVLGLSAGRFKGRKGITPLIAYAGSPSVKSPIWGEKSVNQDESLEKEILWFQDPTHQGFSRCKYWFFYSAILTGIERKELESISPSTGKWFFPYESRPPVPIDGVPYGGKVVPLTKDGGWKVRWIASPYRIHQLALQPMGEMLYDLLRDLPWDCTFDQTKAIPFIQQHLSDGKTAYAVDLKSATDYFPLSLQLSVLRSLSSSADWQMSVDLFRDLARAKWFSPVGDVTWTKGQPMGLYPSFASFSLTHGVLLSFLSTKPNSFFVLGDDVVILDDLLYDRYMKALQLLDCPHDCTKSINSSVVTEFSGKIITKDSVTPQFKWREVSDDSFLDLMRTFGQRFRIHLTHRQRLVYDRVKRLLPPWGCNHSSGSAESLIEVVRLTDEFESLIGRWEFDQKTGRPSKKRKFDASFLGRLSRLLKPSNPASLAYQLRSYEVLRQAVSFDEKLTKAFDKTPFAALPGDRSAVTDVLEFFHGNMGLPGSVPEKVRERMTTLEFFESMFRE